MKRKRVVVPPAVTALDAPVYFRSTRRPGPSALLRVRADKKTLRWRNQAGSTGEGLANVREIARIGTRKPPPTSQTEHKRQLRLDAEYAELDRQWAGVTQDIKRYRTQAARAARDKNPWLARKLRNHAEFKRVEQRRLADRMRQVAAMRGAAQIN